MTSRGLLLFVAVSVLWGIPYLFIAEALDAGLGPFAVVAGRVTVGLVVLMLVTRGATLRLLRRHPWKVLVVALLEVMLPFQLITAGEQTVSSSTAGVLIAVEPFFVLLWTGLVLRSRRPWVRAAVGSAVGFVGVLLLLGTPGAGEGVWMLLTAAALYALGAMLIGHWFADAPSLPLAAATLLVSAPVTLALVPLEGMPSLTTRGVIALVVLGAACTAGGMAAFFALIAEAGAHSASLITYAAPVVAVAVGWAVREEPVTPRMLLGTALILLGAWVCMRRGRTPAAGVGPAT